jgi:hypothetical protein
LRALIDHLKLQYISSSNQLLIIKKMGSQPGPLFFAKVYYFVLVPDESTTTRATSGLDLTARGGKRQGRENTAGMLVHLLVTDLDGPG